MVEALYWRSPAGRSWLLWRATMSFRVSVPRQAPLRKVSDAVLLALFRRFPPTEVIFKEPSTRAEGEYANEEQVPFHWHFHRSNEMFHDKDVLDLGSGFGGRTAKFLEHGARSVVGLEIEQEKVDRGREFAERIGVSDRVTFVLGTGEDIPCDGASFDLITLVDTFEHVVSPRDVLDECWRVLRPGGRVATVFPPYYNLTGGSHLAGYATRIPGMKLIFTTAALKSAAFKRLDEQAIDYEPFFREVPSDKLPNQNGLTVRGFRRLVRESSFEPEQIRYMGHLQYRRDAMNRPKRPHPATLPIYVAAEGAAHIPALRELVCSRICAVLLKPAEGDYREALETDSPSRSDASRRDRNS